MNRGNARYFNSDWHDMAKIDHAREKQLNREHKEVRDEMVYQEYCEGKKTMQEIATDYNIHKSTVQRINKMRGEQ